MRKLLIISILILIGLSALLVFTEKEKTAEKDYSNLLEENTSGVGYQIK